MRRWEQARGQATSEYVALVLLVAVALALAAGLTSGGVAGHVLAGLQRGLCGVAGTACDTPPPPDADLAPCPVERTTRSESLDGLLDVVELRDGGQLSAVRLSDGRALVSLRDQHAAGAELGLGLHVSLGRRRGTEATAEIVASVDSGASWALPSAAAADDFVARYGSKATIAGHGVDALRSACSVLCDALGWHPHAELPPPDELYMDRGVLSRLDVPLPPGLPSVQAFGGLLLGSRLARDGTSTWFVQADAALGAEVARAPWTASLNGAGQGVVSYTLDAHRRPTQLVVRSVARVASRGGAAGTHLRATAGELVVRELDATLDLHDPRNRAAAAALVAALRDPRRLGTLARAAAAVRERVARTGVVDRRAYAVSTSDVQLGGKLAIGSGVGADFERSREGMRLLSAETRLPGLPFLPRDDCRPA